MSGCQRGARVTQWLEVGQGPSENVLGVWFLFDERLDLAKRKGEDIPHKGIARGHQIVQDHLPKSLKIPQTYDYNGKLKNEIFDKTPSAEQIANSFYDLRILVT